MQACFRVSYQQKLWISSVDKSGKDGDKLKELFGYHFSAKKQLVYKVEVLSKPVDEKLVIVNFKNTTTRIYRDTNKHTPLKAVERYKFSDKLLSVKTGESDLYAFWSLSATSQILVRLEKDGYTYVKYTNTGVEN